MIATGLQVRMARAALQWSGKDLAKAAGIGLSTVRKIEAVDDIANVHTSNVLAATRALLETGRIEFIGECTVTLKAAR